MCMTCRIIKHFKEEAERNGNDCELYAVIRRQTYKEGKMNGSVMSGINTLNYCPMCGKRLGDE